MFNSEQEFRAKLDENFDFLTVKINRYRKHCDCITVHRKIFELLQVGEYLIISES